MKLILIDDHPLIARGLGYLLAERGLEVAGHWSDARDLGRRIEDVQPDLVISDIVMPGPCVIEQCRLARSKTDELATAFKLIFLSAHFTDYNLVRCLDLKAEGILTKDDPPTDILHGIDRVLAGETFVSKSLAGRIRTGARPEDRLPMGFETLTAREHEVLKLIAVGMTIRDIARDLHIAIKTVDRHRTNIMNKLGIHSQISLVRYAIREGLVPP